MGTQGTNTIQLALKAGQRKAIIAVIGAYCTILYQVATVILRHMPIDLFLEQYVQLPLIKKGIIVGIKWKARDMRYRGDNKNGQTTTRED